MEALLLLDEHLGNKRANIMLQTSRRATAVIGNPRESLQRETSAVQRPQSAHLWEAGCSG